MEYEPIQAADLLELYLADGMFLAGFLYDSTGKAQPLDAFTHRGMLVDSQLICQKGVRALFECRYYVECGGIRFYGKEFLCRPIQIHNLGSNTLKFVAANFAQRWSQSSKPVSPQRLWSVKVRTENRSEALGFVLP